MDIREQRWADVPNHLAERVGRHRLHKIGLTGVEQTARARAVPLSPESITRGEPPSLSARGPCRHTVAGPGVTGPAGVEEQGIGTAGFPRNLGRPGPSTTHVR